MPQIVPFLIKVGTVATFGAAGGAVAGIIGATVVIGATVAASRILKPKINFNIDDNDRSRQQTVRSTIEPRKLVYGETMVSGPLTYAKVTGSNNEYLHQVIALAGHELTSIKTVFFDDKSIDLTGSNYNSTTKLVTGGFFGPKDNESGVSESIVYIDTRLGAATQTAFAGLRSNSETSSEYLATHRGDGVAAIYTRWLINEGSAETWDEVGNVQNIKCVVQGKKVYDPRLEVAANSNNASFAGQSPTNAAYIKYDDDSLSTGSAQGNYDRGDQGKNPALQLADFLMDSDFGLGIPSTKIDWAAVITAADLCDQLVPIPSSAVQKRFAGSGVIFGADTYSGSISKILSAMNGSLVYSQGKYIMTAGKYVSPSETLTEDDLVGPVQIRTAIPRSDRVNTIKGLFIDPSENYKMMEFGPVTIGASDFNNQTKGAVARDNGEVLTEEVKLPFTDNRYQAQRLALMQVAQSYHQTIVTVPVNLKGMRIAIGDRVNLTLSDFNDVDSGNWSPKVFKCIGWRFADSGEGINLTLIEDDSNNYNDPEASDYSTITAAGVISTALPDVPSPSALTLTSQINAIELNWTNPSNIGAWEQIWIYRSTSATTPTDSSTPIAKLRASSYIDQRAADGTEYYYWIQAVRYPQGSTPTSGNTNKAKSPMVAAGTPASGKIAATKIGQGVMGDDSVGTAQVIDNNIGSAQIATTLQSDNYSAGTAGWQINKSGTAFFQEATIKGGITASSGSIGGITVTSTSLESSNFSSGSAGFKLQSNGTFETGSGTFRGTVNATSGSFSGDVSTDSKFIAGSGATSATMDGNDPNFKFYAGAAAPGDSPFKVDAGGVVTADRIVITRPDDSSAVIFDSAQDGLVGVGLAALSADSDNAVVQVADELTSNTDYARLILSASSQTLTIKVLFPLGYAPFAISSAEDFPDSITLKLQLASVTNGTPGTFVDVNGGTKTFTRRAYNASDASDDDYYSVNTSGTGWYIKGKDAIDDQFNLVMTDSSVYTVGDQAIRVQVSFVAGSGGTSANPSSSSKRTLFFNSATQYFTIDSSNIIRDQAPGSLLTGDVILSAASGARTISWRDTDNQNENWSIEGLTGYQESGSGILHFKFDNGSSTPISFVSNGNILSTGDFYTGTGAITAATASIGGGYGSTGLSIADNGNLSTDGNVIIGGDLTVSGTTTTIDTANLNVEDKNITLNYGTGDTSANAPGAGITIQDAVDASTDATILWDQTNSEFDFSHGATFAGDVTVSGGQIFIGTADSSSAHLNSYELMTFNIDTDNDDTNRYFKWTTNGNSGSGTQLMLLDESGNATFAGEISLSNNQGIFFSNAAGNGTLGIKADTSDRLTFRSGGAWNRLLLDGSGNATFSGTVSSGQITSTINTGVGIRTVYGLFAQFATDSQMDLVSSSAGTWGSAINFVEGADTSNTDVWSIARKTTGGSGDSSLHFNFGTTNSHENTSRVSFSSAGNATFAGPITATGRSTFDSVTIDDDGSGSPILRVVADDLNPWAFQIENDSATNDGLFQAYVNNNNNLYFRARATGAYPTWYLQVSNGTTVVDALSLTSSNATFSGNLDVGGSITKTGNLTVDVSGEIILDSDAEFVRIYHDGGWVGGFQLTNNDFIIRSAVQDKDIIFKGNDNGSVLTALTLDMSNAGAATFNSDIYVPTKIVHTGDTDTYLEFSAANTWRVVAGDEERFKVASGEVTVNESSQDTDFRVESNNNANMLFIDAGNDRVAIGHNAPSGVLHTYGNNVIFDTPDGSGVTVQRNGSTAHIHLFPAYSNVPTIIGQGAGGLHLGYNSTTNGIRIDTSNKVGIGNTVPSSFVESSRFVVGSGTSGTNEMMFLYSGTDAFGAIGFADGTSGTERYRGIVGYHHSSDALFFSTSGGGEADRDLTIDSDGNVLIGKTAVNTFNEGFVAKAVGGANITAAGATVLELNRRSSDGTILNLRKDNTTVGSIGNNTDFYIASQDGTGLRFTSNQVLPCSESGATQNTSRDLGASTAQFKDLYVSGVGHIAGEVNVLTAGTMIQHDYNNEGTYVQEVRGNDRLLTLATKTNDSNAGIVFELHANEKARFDNSGKLLLGDSASHTSDLLQIETPASGGGHGIQIRRNDANGDQTIGTITFGNNTDTDLAQIKAKTDSDGNNGDSGALLFSTQPTGGSLTERLRIQNSGKVYVNKGTSSYTPTTGIIKTYLSLSTDYDAAGTQGIYFSHLDGNWIDGASGADTQYGMLLGYQNAVRGGLIYDHRGSEMMSMWSSYSPIRFMTADSVDGNGVPIDTNIKSRIYVAVGGNVGIGPDFTSPATPLQINHTLPQIRLEETGSGGSKRLDLSVNSSGIAIIGANQSAQEMRLMTTGANRLVVKSNGRIAIGEDFTTPSYALELKEGVGGDWVSRFYNTSTNGLGFLVRTDATAANNQVAFGVYTNSAYLIQARSNGRVGIKNTAPSEVLTVGGVIAASASSYTVNATTANFGFYNGSGTDTAYVQMPASGSFQLWKPNTGAYFIADSGGRIGIQKHPVSTVSLSVKAQATSTSSYGLEITDSSSHTRFLVDGVGNSWFYKTDNLVGMRWDAANVRLGVGTGSPSSLLHVQSNDSTTNATVDLLRLTTLSTGTTTTGFGPEIRFQAERNDGTMQNTGSIASVAEVNSGTNISSALVFKSGNVGTLSEGMRLNKDQQLLIGTQTINPQAGSSNTGVQIGDGFIGVGRDNAELMILNRLSSDGQHLIFRKNGSAIGSIGTIFDDLFIGTDDTCIRFDDTNNAITPRGALGAARDAAIDIGTSSVRFRHVSLSGGVYVGNGSASAPTMTFDSDTDTGFYRYSAGKISMTANGTEAMRMSGFGLDLSMNSSAYVDLNRSGFITFYGTGSNQHGIGSRNASGSADDDIRINSFGAVFINLDSNNNDTSDTHNSFFIGRHGAGAGTIDQLLRVHGDTGDLTTEGNVTAFGSTSDIRLKENIEVIPNALEKVQKLRGITFNYKKDGSRSTGLIAQELEEVLPEVVYTETELDGENPHLAVRYGNTAGLLVEAIKEQQRTIDALLERITKLEKSNGSDKNEQD